MSALYGHLDESLVSWFSARPLLHWEGQTGRYLEAAACALGDAIGHIEVVDTSLADAHGASGPQQRCIDPRALLYDVLLQARDRISALQGSQLHIARQALLGMQGQSWALEALPGPHIQACGDAQYAGLLQLCQRVCLAALPLRVDCHIVVANQYLEAQSPVSKRHPLLHLQRNAEGVMTQPSQN